MKTLILRAVEISGSQKSLANQLGVSHQAVWAWINRGSVPHEYGAAIEQATNGGVLRKQLWPNDWHLIWPELKKQEEVAR
jgi:DNA-binding transcriptional regulator YdaS (Cro superfamily)